MLFGVAQHCKALTSLTAQQQYVTAPYIYEIICVVSKKIDTFAPDRQQFQANVNMKKAILMVRVSTAAQDLAQQTNKMMEHAIADGYARENIIVIEEKE